MATSSRTKNSQIKNSPMIETYMSCKWPGIVCRGGHSKLVTEQLRVLSSNRMTLLIGIISSSGSGHDQVGVGSNH